MAFLRSIAGSNQSSLVSRKILLSSTTPSSIRAAIHHLYNANQLLTTQLSNRTDSVAFHQHRQFHLSSKRELNTTNNNDIEATKTHKSPAAGTVSATINGASNAPSQRDPLDVSFNDPVAAFKSKTTRELIRAYFVYIMCSSEYLVENNMKVNLKWRVTISVNFYYINKAIVIQVMIYWFFATHLQIFEWFLLCSGEDTPKLNAHQITSNKVAEFTDDVTF